MTDAKINNSFYEKKAGVKQVSVTNNLGRDADHLELVYLSGFFGEVRDFDGIADEATGYVNIDHEREINTTQINTTDTFVVGGVVYFVPGGSSAAGVLRAGYIVTGVPVGVCISINAGVSIIFRPYAQNIGSVRGVNATEYAVTASHATAIAITGVPVGAKIIDVMVKATATSSSGTLTLRSDADSPAAITSAITCAASGVVARTASLANDVVTADGLQVLANGAADRGVITIFWR